jgi:hypothetical protein
MRAIEVSKDVILISEVRLKKKKKKKVGSGGWGNIFLILLNKVRKCNRKTSYLSEIIFIRKDQQQHSLS